MAEATAAPTDLLIPRADVVLREARDGVPEVSYRDVRVVFLDDVVRVFDANGNMLAYTAGYTFVQHGDSTYVLGTPNGGEWTITRRQGCCGG